MCGVIHWANMVIEGGVTEINGLVQNILVVERKQFVP